ncbi:unnamed protein product [Lampetra planeri]
MPRLLPLAATQAPRTGRNGPMLRGSNRKTPSETMVADAPVSTRIHTSTPCTCSTTAEDLAAAATMRCARARHWRVHLGHPTDRRNLPGHESDLTEMGP